MSNQDASQPYRGYPYSNPMVTDAPSVSPAAADQWRNLPKRQLYNRRTDEIQLTTQPDTDEPVEVTTPSADREIHARPGSLDQVVYIDLPETQESTTNTTHWDRNAEAASAEATIFYDPFENRRIELNSPKDGSIQEVEEEQSAETSPGPRIPPRQQRLPNLSMPGSSSGRNPRPPSSAIPAIMQKEVNVYRRPMPDEDFTLTPIPVSEFPEPPPAYTESDVASVTTNQPRRSSAAPRTQVTVSPSALPFSADRKHIHCPYCGVKVHTLVIRQAGAATHLVALMFLMICLFPVTAAIYCTDCCKYKNHYCPTCNHLIGYQVPMLCQDMVYVKI